MQRGLLATRTDEADRRRVFVSLTPDGQAILDRITTANRHELQQLGGALFRDSLLRDVLGDAEATPSPRPGAPAKRRK